MDNKQLGKLGEDATCQYLKRQGFRILERNYIKEWDDKTKGEIDIIAKKDGVLCFVEVKTSARGSFHPERAGRVEGFAPENARGRASNVFAFAPEDRVNFKKQRQLVKLAQTWLAKNKLPLDCAWQIDVVGVILDEANLKEPKISYFGNEICGH